MAKQTKKAPPYKGPPESYEGEDPGKRARTAAAIAKRDPAAWPVEGADLPAELVEPAVTWLQKNWKWPIDRDRLVRGVITAYEGAKNAKR